MMRYVYLPMVILCAVSLGACTPNIGANNYQTGETQQVSSVQKGTIISIETVEVSAGSNGNMAGTLAGGAAGGIAGASIGQGFGSGLAAVGGAVAGGILGNMAEKKLTSQQATRYIIQLTNGTTIAVVQKDNPPLAVGTKVLVIGGKPAQVVVDTAN